MGEREVNRVAILDRDGTIIDVVRDEETGAIGVAFHPAQLRLLPGAVEGMRALQEAGFVLAIATNQPAPAKGQFSAAAVARTNEALVALLAGEGVRISAVEACLHHPEGGRGGDASLVRECDCRKPKPGMLHALLGRLDGDPASSWMIGDSEGDVRAGKAAGVRTGLLLASNRCELCPLRPPRLARPGAPAPPDAPDAPDTTESGIESLVPDVHAPTLDALARAIAAYG
jgi:D-glycero-D-manno-heptose 1,7-bisphosphate phosphatase